jgi:hypothetical protein
MRVNLAALTRLIPVIPGDPESYFEALQDHLKSTLRKHLQDEFKKRSDNGFKAVHENEKSPISRADFEKFNGVWEKFFDDSISISFEKDVIGYTNGKPSPADHVVINIDRDFEERCARYGAHISSMFQSAGAKFFADKGFNVKGFKPVVTTRALKAA